MSISSSLMYDTSQQHNKLSSMCASKLKQLRYTKHIKKNSKSYAIKFYLTIESFIQLLFLITGDITLIQLRQTTPNPARSFIDFNSFIEISKTWTSFKNGLVKFTLDKSKHQQYMTDYISIEKQTVDCMTIELT